MRKFLVLMLCLIFVFSLAGCSSERADDGKITIVATAFPHYDFARTLCEGIDAEYDIKMLIAPGNEVHTYEPSPSDILAISQCDLFIYTGGESDTWVKNVLESAGNEDMKVISFMDICGGEKHEEAHEGHEHTYDEHVWTSPKNVELIVTKIASALSEIDKAHEKEYNKNLLDYTRKWQLAELHQTFKRIFEECVRNEIVVADRFPFYHLAEEYGFEYVSAYPGCSSSTEPSASVIAELSDKVKSENIPYVFTIEFSNQKIAKSVIEGTDAKILTLHSCHNVSKEDFEKGITYYDLMKQNAANLRKALCE